jgi:hypothetical protein
MILEGMRSRNHLTRSIEILGKCTSAQARLLELGSTWDALDRTARRSLGFVAVVRHPRTLLMSLVRVPTSTSRAPQIDFGSRAGLDGMWTDGTSVCHDALLSCCASHLVILDAALAHSEQSYQLAGTTRTWWPAASAASATLNASTEVSITMRLGAEVATSSVSLRVGTFRSSKIVLSTLALRHR